MAAIALARFVYSVVFTHLNPDVAYFSTFTRAWEFAAGGLLAIALRRIATPFGVGRASAAASWVGIAMIASAMLLFTGALPFPSYTAALPVVGAILVIAAGSPAAWAAARAHGFGPVQFLGDVSYGVYL